jgi:hypothetical protein
LLPDAVPGGEDVPHNQSLVTRQFKHDTIFLKPSRRVDHVQRRATELPATRDAPANPRRHHNTSSDGSLDLIRVVDLQPADQILGLNEVEPRRHADQHLGFDESRDDMRCFPNRYSNTEMNRSAAASEAGTCVRSPAVAANWNSATRSAD